jgi:hypothetical protein
MIEPNIDLYGSRARSSSIADFLEAMSLSGKTMSHAQLGDYIEDAGWSTKLKEHFMGPGIDDDEDAMGTSSAQARARKVFDLLRERAVALGEHYPFTVDDSGVRVCNGQMSQEGYLVLLGISLAHSYDLKTSSGLDPKQVMEDVTLSVMDAHGMQAKSTAFSKQSGTFSDLLIAAGLELDLQPTPGLAHISKQAKDEGVDIVCVFGWKDKRPGRWTFIGQVTCAASDNWQKKLSEPSPHQWKEILGTKVSPIPFLAIPYHVQHGHLLDLMGKANATVLDRLRLAPFIPTGNCEFLEFANLAKFISVADLS